MSNLPAVRSPEQQRAQARNMLVRHAATRPANIAAGVGGLVLGAGGLGILGLAPLAILVGLAAYLLMSARTFFNEGEADRVFGQARTDKDSQRVAAQQAQVAAPVNVDMSSIPSFLVSYVRDAMRIEQSVRDALAQTDSPMELIGTEVRGIVEQVVKTAQRTKTIETYVNSQNMHSLQIQLNDARRADPNSDRARDLNEQLKSLYRLQRNVEGAGDTLKKLTSSLSAIASRIVETALLDDNSSHDDLLLQARSLRGQVDDMQAALKA